MMENTAVWDGMGYICGTPDDTGATLLAHP